MSQRGPVAPSASGGRQSGSHRRRAWQPSAKYPARPLSHRTLPHSHTAPALHPHTHAQPAQKMPRKRPRTPHKSDNDDDDDDDGGATEIHAASSPAPGPAAAVKKSQRERRWAKKKAKLLQSMRAVPSLPAAGPANGDGGGASNADSHELPLSDNKESQSDEVESQSDEVESQSEEKESQSEPEPDGDDDDNDDDNDDNDDDDDGGGGGGEGGGGNEGESTEQASALQGAVRKPSEQGEAVQMQPASNDERQQHADDVQRKYFQPYQFPAMPREEDRALFDTAPPQMRVQASSRPRTPLATVYCTVCTSTLHADHACPELTVRAPTPPCPLPLPPPPAPLPPFPPGPKCPWARASWLIDAGKHSVRTAASTTYTSPRHVPASARRRPTPLPDRRRPTTGARRRAAAAPRPSSTARWCASSATTAPPSATTATTAPT